MPYKLAHISLSPVQCLLPRYLHPRCLLLDVFQEFLFLLSPSLTIQQSHADNQVASVCLSATVQILTGRGEEKLAFRLAHTSEYKF